MAIERIDHESCNGCGTCVEICIMDVLRMDEIHKKAVIQYPDECILGLTPFAAVPSPTDRETFRRLQ